jgi:hypothetical protein
MKGKLEFTEYDFESQGYQPVPKPSLNGGLYTGEPFHPNAPYGNIHIDPDVTEYMYNNLRRGNKPPPNARLQYPATRSGNSYVEWRGLSRYEGTNVNWGPHNIYCAPVEVATVRRCFCEDICPGRETSKCNKNNCMKKPIADQAHATYYNKLYYVA